MPASEPSDEELLLATQRDAESFGMFYRRYERFVLAYFLRRTEDAEAAADLTAESFAAALTSSRRFRDRGPGSATAWLLQIMRHTLSRAARKRRIDDQARRRLGMGRIELSDERVDELTALASAGTKPLEEMLDRLPPDQRDALRARVIEERGYKELAVDMAVSEATVRKRVSRALATLRADLEDV
jgi:RNA polymerase sigma-70 factor (ECF subfamily)